MSCSRLQPAQLGAGEILIQDQQRHYWGGLLPPGEYSSIELEDTRQSCIFMHQDDRPLFVFGDDGGVVRTTGEPWTRSPDSA